MTSDRQNAANRRNARESTGPKSQGGKNRAARNSLKHGLTTSITNDARHASEIDKLAIGIAGHTGDLNILECARVVAAAERELDQIRRIRIGLIEGAGVFGSAKAQRQGGSCEEEPPMKGADESTENAVRKALPNLQRILRYERRAAAKRDKALRRLVLLKTAC